MFHALYRNDSFVPAEDPEDWNDDVGFAHFWTLQEAIDYINHKSSLHDGKTFYKLFDDEARLGYNLEGEKLDYEYIKHFLEDEPPTEDCTQVS